MSKVLSRAELFDLEIKYAKDYNLSVKNVKTFRGHDGMTGVNADIYKNNKKFAHFYDDARGGEPEVHWVGKNDIEYQANRTILRDLEDKFKKIPQVKFRFNDSDAVYDNTFYFDHVVNALINHTLEQKELAKQAKKGVVFVDPKDDETYTWGWSYDIPKLFKVYPTKALTTVQNRVDILKADGCIIKNTELLSQYGVRV